MNILIDMNLSPEWCSVLRKHGWESVHWSAVGLPTAPDTEIMAWAVEHGHVVFTHELDFGTVLAITEAAGPSVVQVRTQDVTPGHLESIVVAALKQSGPELERGALVSVDESRARVRILPLRVDRP
jgi:predicted nuclease of predicted toxin-antitoxin system